MKIEGERELTSAAEKDKKEEDKRTSKSFKGKGKQKNCQKIPKIFNFDFEQNENIEKISEKLKENMILKENSGKTNSLDY